MLIFQSFSRKMLLVNDHFPRNKWLFFRSTRCGRAPEPAACRPTGRARPAMMTPAGQQRPVRVMPNNIAREKNENKYFQNITVPIGSELRKINLSRSYNFRYCRRKSGNERRQPKIDKDFPPQNTWNMFSTHGSNVFLFFWFCKWYFPDPPYP